MKFPNLSRASVSQLLPEWLCVINASRSYNVLTVHNHLIVNLYNALTARSQSLVSNASVNRCVLQMNIAIH